MILAWVWQSWQWSSLGLMNYKTETHGFGSSWGCVLVWFLMTILEWKEKNPNPKISISVLGLTILAWVWCSRHQSGLGLMNCKNGTCGFKSSWGCVLVWFLMNYRNWNLWIGYRSSSLVFDELHKLEVWNLSIVWWSGNLSSMLIFHETRFSEVRVATVKLSLWDLRC